MAEVAAGQTRGRFQRSNPPRHLAETSAVKPRAAKHVAKATPVGRVAETAAVGVEKVRARRVEAKEARTAQRTRVKTAVQREEARITAANTLIRRPRIRMLAAEYLFGILMAILLLFFGPGSYHVKMGKFFLQITGLSALFFVLSLTAASERASRTAIMFGALIDIVLLLNLTKKVAPNLKHGGGPATIPADEVQSYAEESQPELPSFAQLAQLGKQPTTGTLGGDQSVPA